MSYRTPPTFIIKNQSGFTLIELMVALILGLLISAAALQVFYTSSVNNNRQAAGSQIQNTAVFGVEDFSKSLRRANYGANSNNTSSFYLNHLTPQGGVVLTRPTGTKTTGTPPVTTVTWVGSNLNGLKGSAALPTSILSANASENSASNIGITNSDQLTIQYQAYQNNIFSCDGERINKNDYVVERYFVRADNNLASRQNGLACASMIYTYNVTAAEAGIDVEAKLAKLTGTGIIIIPNVDYFRVLLGTTAQNNFATNPADLSIVYQPIPANPATTLAGQRIVSLQVGLLTHSDTATTSKQDNTNLRFNILDKRDQKLEGKVAAGGKYLRDVYETTILIRNARGKP
ncbi:PilW family protein [Psychrobacter glacincola]|uniref:PilW family protein n=1 Tax=Psychrobacter glacincola TaxID=56810 RepID=UPI0039B01C54